ncbi:MAG: FliM/FliN family flagellar motor switch protein [Candidatus Latescibacteria bacterium]|nr:FliM/FliN family flagellar motor switch protein [Candidatus Latescibacterota bacterium]
MATKQQASPKPTREPKADPPINLAQLQGVKVRVSMELGRTEKTLYELLDIGEQSLIELDKRAGEPIDLFLNGQLFARGEVVTVGENFGVRVTEILGREPEAK